MGYRAIFCAIYILRWLTLKPDDIIYYFFTYKVEQKLSYIMFWGKSLM